MNTLEKKQTKQVTKEQEKKLYEQTALSLKESITKQKEEKKRITRESVTSDIFFSIVMSNFEVCAAVINLILNKDVKVRTIDRIFLDEDDNETHIEDDRHLISVLSQFSIQNKSAFKSIRFDILAEDEEGILYNIEMQRALNDNFSKRVRYYQGMMDTKMLKKGINIRYDKLPRTYIIFITENDYFKLGHPIYTFTQRCHEENELEMNDETTKIFINLSSTLEDARKLGLLEEKIDNVHSIEYYKILYHFIDVLNGKMNYDEVLTNKYLKILVDKINKTKKDSEVFKMTTTLSQLMEQEKLEGLEEGIEKGIEQGLKQGIEKGIGNSIEILKELGLSEEEIITKISKKYNITEEKTKKYLN